MTTYTWTDDMMRSGSTCDVDKVADNLMHLKYNAGGLLPVNNLGTKTSNFTLEPNKIDTADITASLTISLPTTGFISGVENKCVLNFTTTSTSSPTLPTGLKWSNKNSGKAPTVYSTLSGVRNVLVFTTLDSGTTWEAEYASYGGVVTAFNQPTLTSNGILGGSSFAVSATSIYNATYDAYQAFNHTYWWSGTGSVDTYIIYNPIPINITNIGFEYCDGMGSSLSIGFYGSQDGSTYTYINTYTMTYSAYTNVSFTGNTGYYKYNKLICTKTAGTYIEFRCNLTATYIAV